MPKSFLDSNVLVYALDHDEPVKQARARQLLASFGSGEVSVVSTQILQESYVAAIRQLHADPIKTRAFLQRLPVGEVVTVTPELVFAAMDCCLLEQLSFWDALVLTAAAAAGCVRVYTEDLTDGRVIAGVRIENPFLSA
jgi:predicted nucleic acid-binding protein